MVLDGELLCANSGWSYALVYDAFDRHVLLKKVTRFNPVVASLTLKYAWTYQYRVLYRHVT